MTTVDWSKPIEAVHEDGRVMPAQAAWSRADGAFEVRWKNYALPCSGAFTTDGMAVAAWPWRIRNVAQSANEQFAENAKNSTRPSDEVVGELIALARAVAGLEDGSVTSVNVQTAKLSAVHVRAARKVLDKLPEPVDADLVEARRIAAGEHDARKEIGTAARIRIGHGDHFATVTIALAALRRGKQMAGEA